MPSEQTTPSRAELIAKYDILAVPAGFVNPHAAEFRAIADALRDAERLDWLESKREVFGPWVDYECVHSFKWQQRDDRTLRTAIDAARGGANV